MPKIHATTRRRWPISHDRMEQALIPWEPSRLNGGFILCPIPGSSITVERDGLEWRFSVDTDVFGPGLHAIFYDLLKSVAESLHLIYTLYDPSHFNRDFSAQRLTDFYARELVKVADVLEKQEPGARFQTHWALPGYALIEGAGVAGPISRWGREEFLRRVRENAAAMAEDFYITPHIGADGHYHRNAALYLLQNEITYLSPEEMPLAAQVCHHLEAAAQLNPDLPLPLDEYLRCAQFTQRDPSDLPNPALPWGLIGYRRENLRHTMEEGFSWIHPGHLREAECEGDWQIWADKSLYLRYRIKGTPEDTSWPNLENAFAFQGMPAPELAHSDTALGLKCYTELSEHQYLEIQLDFEAPYTWEDIWAILNSVQAHDSI